MHASHQRLSKMKSRALEEAKRFLVMFVYLWVLFGLFVLHESIILREHGINFTGYGFAFVNALVLAKVMLVAEDLHLGRGFEDRPLIVPILYKSAAFALVFIAFHIAESVLVGAWRGATIEESLPKITGGRLTGLLTVAVIVTVALIPFFAFGELDRVLGEGKLRSLVFTGKRKTAAADR